MKGQDFSISDPSRGQIGVRRHDGDAPCDPRKCPRLFRSTDYQTVVRRTGEIFGYLAKRMSRARPVIAQQERSASISDNHLLSLFAYAGFLAIGMPARRPSEFRLLRSSAPSKKRTLLGGHSKKRARATVHVIVASGFKRAT